ncbi:MAG: tetratricopeptide repeat protein [Candidatus Omnitrophica bacterium]|nr:tetratricopeptide repeat protein [Candidatus Omnitrophota bacterium]
MNIGKYNLRKASINIFAALLFITANAYAQDPEKEMFDKGNDYFKSKLYDRAISAFNTAIQIKPGYSAAYYHRGRAYAENGDIDQAISDYAKAIELNANYTKAYYRRGLAYAKKGDLDQAISDYAKAIELDPKLAGAYNNRASAYFLKQEYNKCWEDVHRLEALGEKPHPEFLEQLKKLSGRER